MRLGFRFFILIMLIALFGFFTAQSLLVKYNGFAALADLLVFETTFYNTLHGAFLYNFRGGDVCHLGIHFAPMLVFHIPFYAIYRHVYTLFLVQGLWIGLGALGIFLLASRLLKDETASLFLAIAYLINPALLGGALWSIHEDPLAATFFTFALYAWVMRRKTAFWLLILCAILCKETMALVVSFLGLAFLIRYRHSASGRRTGILLFLLGAGWFFIATRLLMPLFSPLSLTDLQLPARYDAKIGHSITEMFVNFFRHPVFFFKTALKTPKIIYLAKLFLPFAFLCLLSPALLLPAMPVILMNILSYKVNLHATLLHQYTIPTVPFFFFAMLDGLRRLRIWLYRYRKGRQMESGAPQMRCFLRVVSVLLLGCAAATLLYSEVFAWAFFSRDETGRHWQLFSKESRAAAHQALALIPPDAAVAASPLVANHLAKRKIIYYNTEPEIRMLPFEYFIMVKTGIRGNKPEEFSEETINFLRKNCRVIYAKGRFLVLKRNTKPLTLEEFRRQRRRKNPDARKNPPGRNPGGMR